MLVKSKVTTILDPIRPLRNRIGIFVLINDLEMSIN